MCRGHHASVCWSRTKMFFNAWLFTGSQYLCFNRHHGWNCWKLRGIYLGRPLWLARYVFVCRSYFDSVALFALFAIRYRNFPAIRAVQLKESLATFQTVSLPLRKLIFLPGVARACVIHTATSGILFNFGSFWNIQIALAWKIPESDCAFIGSAFYLGFAIGTPLVGWWAVHVGPRKPMIVSCVVGIAALLFWILVPIVWPLWCDALNVFLVGLAISSYPISFIIASQFAPTRNTAAVIGIVNFVGIIAGTIFGLIPSLFTQVQSLSELAQIQFGTMIFVVVLVVALIAAVGIPKRNTI